MIEAFVIYLIVGFAVLWAGRSVYRSMTGKSKGGCSCGASKTCHASQGGCADISDNNQQGPSEDEIHSR